MPRLCGFLHTISSRRVYFSPTPALFSPGHRGSLLTHRPMTILTLPTLCSRLTRSQDTVPATAGGPASCSPVSPPTISHSRSVPAPPQVPLSLSPLWASAHAIPSLLLPFTTPFPTPSHQSWVASPCPSVTQLIRSPTITTATTGSLPGLPSLGQVHPQASQSTPGFPRQSLLHM